MVGLGRGCNLCILLSYAASLAPGLVARRSAVGSDQLYFANDNGSGKFHRVCDVLLSRNELLRDRAPVSSVCPGSWLSRARRHATGVFQRRAGLGLEGAIEGSSKGEAQRMSWFFAGLIKTTHRLATEKQGNAQHFASQMFETAQWGQSSDAAASLAVNRHPSLTPHRRAMLTPSQRELLRLQSLRCSAAR